MDNEEAKVSGIAKLAVDKGFDQLSALQKAVITPHLQRACEGAIHLSHDGLDIAFPNTKANPSYGVLSGKVLGRHWLRLERFKQFQQSRPRYKLIHLGQSAGKD